MNPTATFDPAEKLDQLMLDLVLAIEASDWVTAEVKVIAAEAVLAVLPNQTKDQKGLEWSNRIVEFRRIITQHRAATLGIQREKITWTRPVDV